MSVLKSVKIGKLAALTALAAACFIALPVGQAAAQNMGGGFSGPGPEVVTVQKAQNMPDDARVTLKGNIVKSLGDEDYLFRDATGTIEVEIDDDLWYGRTVNPETVVTISGELDRDWNRVSLDVSSINR